MVTSLRFDQQQLPSFEIDVKYLAIILSEFLRGGCRS